MRAILVSLTALVGCTWVTASDLEARLPDVDDDGDGVNKSEDCNDGDAGISPDAVEVWYDGVDSDCAQDDDFDADKDGYVATAHAGLPTEGVDGTGLLEGNDCDDALATVNPDAADVWYDGIDTNCDLADDYDADADGYASEDYASSYGATTYAAGTGVLTADDCEDDDSAIHPAIVETWYNGVDENCAEDDDYDADADGFSSEANPDPDAEPPSNDCDDAVFDVHPGAEDAWYDGIDADCDEVDDFDADSDGFASLLHASTYGPTTYAEEVTGLLEPTDCDDTQTTGPDINPDQLEILGDAAGADEDCYGDSDVFSLTHINDFASIEGSEYDSIDWTGPLDAVWAESSSTTYLSVIAEQIDLVSGSGTTTYYESGVAFKFSNVAPEEGWSAVIPWMSQTGSASNTLGPRHEALATTSYLFAGVGMYNSSDEPFVRMMAKQVPSGQQNKISAEAISDATLFDDVTLAIDGSNRLHVLSCGEAGDTSYYISLAKTNAQNGQTNGMAEELLSAYEATACAMHFYDENKVLGSTGTAFWATAAGLVTSEFTLDKTQNPPALTMTDVSTDSTYDVVDFDIPYTEEGPWIVFADAESDSIIIWDPDGDEHVYPVSGGIESMEATYLESETSPTMVIGFVDGSGMSSVLVGHPDEGWVEHAIETGFSSAHKVAAQVDQTTGYLMVAVIGTPATSSYPELVYGLAKLD